MRRPLVLALVGALGLTLTGLAGTASAAAENPARGWQDTWHSRQADLTVAAQDAGQDGRGVIVAVLDTWIDVTHPDFQGRAGVGVDCVGGSCRTGQTRDACVHGTHVAGTVGSSSFGVAPGAVVLPVQVLSFDATSGECLGRPEDVAAGIRYAVGQGARVINLSLGADTAGTDDGPLPKAVDAAAAAGVVVVLSAGNGDVPITDVYGSKALVVAATGADGALASYSQREGGVDLAAPGGDATDGSCSESTCVTSLFPDGRYAVAAGTSMSAPVISGVAALLLAQDPRRTAQDVSNLLTTTAKPLDGAGAGLVDASAALGVTPAVPRPRQTDQSSADALLPAGTVPLAQEPPTTRLPVPAPPISAGPSSPSMVTTPRVEPAPVALRPATLLASDSEVPFALRIGALLMLAAAGAATTVVQRTRTA